MILSLLELSFFVSSILQAVSFQVTKPGRVVQCNGQVAENYSPVVGILAEDCWAKADIKEGASHIQASYVQWAEQAGIRVVPVFLNRSQTYYAQVYKRVSGLILPGGGVIMNVGDYYNTTKLFLKWSSQDYLESGKQFPIWGTCMGFEVLAYILNGEKECRYFSYGTDGVSLPLNFTENVEKSRMFENAPGWLIETLRNKPITANFHSHSISKKFFESNSDMNTTWNLLSTNEDANGIVFVSTVEHKLLPIYGSQWHPEKNQFVYAEVEDPVNHSVGAIRVMQYFADFFANELRKSCNVYPEEDFAKDQIWNYKIVYSLSSLNLKFYFDN